MSEENSHEDKQESENYWRVDVPKPGVLVKKAQEFFSKFAPKKCPNCGKNISPDYKICPYCGTPITQPSESKMMISCSSCGKSISSDFNVCPFCGKPVEEVEKEPEQPITKSCSNCGKSISPDFKVCPFCGTNVTQIPTPLPAQPPSKPSHEKKKAIKEKRKKPIEKKEVKQKKGIINKQNQIIEKAEELLESGKPEQAIDLLQTVVESEETSEATAEAFHILGLSHAKLTKHTEAIGYFEKALQIHKKILGDDWAKPMFDMGDSYYAQRRYVKAGKSYHTAYNMENYVHYTSYPAAGAYIIIDSVKNELKKTGKEKKLFGLRPGVATMFLNTLPNAELEKGTQRTIMLALFNGSKKKAKVTATPDFPKEIITDSLKSFTIELWPGQYFGKVFPVSAKSDAALKEYRPSIEIKSKAMKYRAAEKGIEMTAEITDELIPFSGILVSWLGGRRLKNELTISLVPPLKVVGEWKKWKVYIGTDEETAVSRELHSAWESKWDLKDERATQLVASCKKVDHYTELYAIRKIITSWGYEMFGEEALKRYWFPVYVLVEFESNAPKNIAERKIHLLLANPQEGGFRLCAVNDKKITKTDFFNIMDIIIDDPEKVKELKLFSPLWVVK